MERKTWVASADGFEDVGLRDGVSVEEAICDLAAYENIGLEPDKITDLLYAAVKLIASMRNSKKAALWMRKYGKEQQ